MKDQKTTTNESASKVNVETPRNVGTKQFETKTADKPVVSDSKNKMNLID